MNGPQFFCDRGNRKKKVVSLFRDDEKGVPFFFPIEMEKIGENKEGNKRAPRKKFHVLERERGKSEGYGGRRAEKSGVKKFFRERRKGVERKNRFVAWFDKLGGFCDRLHDLRIRKNISQIVAIADQRIFMGAILNKGALGVEPEEDPFARRAVNEDERVELAVERPVRIDGAFLCHGVEKGAGAGLPAFAMIRNRLRRSGQGMAFHLFLGEDWKHAAFRRRETAADLAGEADVARDKLFQRAHGNYHRGRAAT